MRSTVIVSSSSLWKDIATPRSREVLENVGLIIEEPLARLAT
jgi:hypothetical protein